ncbi:MAG: divalent metal cation transporter [Saprospiraceae bacterium]|nr:divalent metal cation transporter [Saprospiraceae bacterium]
MKLKRASVTLLGAAFLMATSAIGPGFLTQTTVFTAQLGASFGFAILLSFLLDVGAQVNIWRVITVSELPAPQLSNRVLPGLGTALTLLVLLGGLAFNIGNIAGCGLGMQVLSGVPSWLGASISAILSIALFWAKEAGRILDWFAKVLGLLMILLTAWVAFSNDYDGLQIAKGMFWPDRLDPLALLTIVGGTVGGYISFAGAHRLLEAGMSGTSALNQVTKSAYTGIGIATLMRLLLFLAAFGVVSSGAEIDPSNPPASVFQHAAGNLGYRFFGLVMWSAAITSVVGCSFTTISFVTATFPQTTAKKPWLIGLFVMISAGIFLCIGKPVQLMILAGTVNGFILPVALAAILIAAENTSLMKGYRLPIAWKSAGWAIVLLMGSMAIYSLL